MVREGAKGEKPSFVKRYFLHEKTMRSFLRSYILVFLLPVLLVYITMLSTGYNSVRENNMNAMRFAAAQTRHQMDNQLYSLLAVSTTISNSSDFLSLATLPRQQLDEASVMSMYSLSQYFKQMYSITNQFTQMVLYMPENGYSVSIRNALPIGAPSDLEDMEVLISDDAVWNTLSSGEGMTPLLLENGDSVMYCMQLPGVGQQLGTLMVPLRKEYMSGLFSVDAKTPTFGGVISVDGTPLYSRDLPTAKWSGVFKGSEGVCAIGENIYVYEKLNNANAYVVLGTTRSSLNANFWQQNVSIIPMMAVTVVLFALITFRCAIRNYDPIKKLCSMAVKEGDGEEFDAVQAIRAQLLEAMDVKRGMESSKKLMGEIERGSWMFRELRSKNADRMLQQSFDMDAGEIPGYRWACVCAVLADKFSGLFKVDESEGISLDWIPLFSDCLIEMLDDGCRALPLFMGNSAMFLIRMEKDVDLKRILVPIRELLIESYTYETSIAVSEYVQGSTPFADQFRRMSDHCMLMIEKGASVGEDSILSYTELLGSRGNVPGEAVVLEAHLYDALRRGEISDAVEILDRMNRVLVPLCDSDKAESDSAGVSKNALAEWIRSVVEKEYTDSGLSVTAIAERAGRSPDYISRCFRQAFDIGLLDYIHRTRIARAKELLCDASISVGSVAKQVGYSSVDSFIRVFKKLEQVTPGKYQNGEKSE